MAQIKINNLQSGVYRLSPFKNLSKSQKLWGENIHDFFKNWIGLVQENFIAPVWKISSFILKKTSPVIPYLASLVKRKDSHSECTLIPKGIPYHIFRLSPNMTIQLQVVVLQTLRDGNMGVQIFTRGQKN